jgi:hypothetical protein
MIPAGHAGSPDGSPSALPLCGPEDLAVTVHWERDGASLRGQVIARNTGARACRLAGKPAVTPLALDGTPLPAETVVTLEMIHPGYVILQPGQSAAAPLSWGGWCGPRASDRAQVNLGGGTAVADVHGPLQPECSPEGASNLSSSWFHLIE